MANFKVYEKYNADWKNKGWKSRACKFLLKTELPQATLDEITQHRNYLSKIIFKRIVDNTLTKDEFSKTRKLRDNLQKEFRNYFNLESSSWERAIVCSVLERYKSGLRRNKKFAKNKIHFRDNKAFYIYENIFNYKSKVLKFKIPRVKEKMQLDYCIPGTMNKYEPYLLKGMGGNLINKKMLVARAKVPITWKYQPKDVIGMDINQRPDVFAVLSNGTILPFSKELRELTKEIDSLNEEIKNTNKSKSKLNSKQRRRRRLRIIKLHKKQNRIIQKEYVLPIIELTIKNKWLLAIDDTTGPGKKRGTYGQDKIIPGLVREAENKCMPHLLVPPYLTSQICEKCNSRVTRPKDNEIICPKCGKIDADLNGAKNVARFGQKIWIDGFTNGSDWKSYIEGLKS